MLQKCDTTTRHHDSKRWQTLNPAQKTYRQQQLPSLHRRVRGAPWRATNRLHGQRTGAFSWRPMLRPLQEHRPIPARPYPELRTLMVVRSGVISVSPRTRDMLRHLPTCDQCPGFVPHAYQPPPPSMPHPTYHSLD